MRVFAHSIAQHSLGFPMGPESFRQTPENQPTVEDLLAPCDTVKTSYGTDPFLVRRITRCEWNGLVHWSIALSEPGEIKVSAGINDLVAVDGRLLKLFGNNDDEVFKVNADPTANSKGQLILFS